MSEALSNDTIAIEDDSKETLEKIINEYSQIVYILAYRIIGIYGTREDLEECVSDVFVEVWNNINDFNSEKGTFKTWILIKTKYKALDFRRKLIKKCNLYKEQNIGSEYIDKNEDCSKNVEHEVISKDNYLKILEAINSLNTVDKEIFKRRYFLYEDIDSIAKSFKMTRQAVDNRLWRGRKSIKQALETNKMMEEGRL